MATRVHRLFALTLIHLIHLTSFRVCTRARAHTHTHTRTHARTHTHTHTHDALQMFYAPRMIYNGVYWFVLPATLVIFNDIMAYVFPLLENTHIVRG
jgi:CDP-diglyceride synthetase